MFKKRYVAAAACALAMVGTANAVQVSRDGTGDFLIAPAYFIGGGMTTDLKIVNTSSTHSTVAKVIFRHPVTSAEIMDFLVYLSPSDVWTGTLSCTIPDPATQNCISSRVLSDDDSIQHVNSNDFISAANPGPVIYQNDVTTGRTPLPNQGYVEVVMGGAYKINPGRPGVKKEDIFAFNRYTAPDFIDPMDATMPRNILTGTVTANVPGLGSATLPMLALSDYRNTRKMIVGGVSGLDDADQFTPLADVEEVLWKNNLAVPYSVGANKLSLVTFTFPTKLTYRGRNGGQYPFDVTPSKPMGERKVCLNATIFDNSENERAVNISPLGGGCLDEFGWLVFGAGANIDTGNFAEGWARMRFNAAPAANAQVANPADTSNLGRQGAPAIVTYMMRDQGKFTWSYAASSRN